MLAWDLEDPLLSVILDSDLYSLPDPKDAGPGAS